MAFTRKFLNALGIEAEKVDEIMSAHVEVTDGLKADLEKVKADADKLAETQKELEEANKKLAKYSEKGEVVAKADFDKVNGELEKLKQDVLTKETKQAKEHALRELYKAIGISEKRINTVMKVTDLDEIELDENGQIKDADARTESAKTEWADFIESTDTKGAETANPPQSNPTSKDPFEVGFDEG